MEAWYTISGEVVSGQRLGRRLGFPTANLVVDEAWEAPDGVYAAYVETGGGRYEAMANLGYRPSVEGDDDDGERRLEVNLFGFDGDLYGKTITVTLLRFVRPERKFDTLYELTEMVDEDRRTIKDFFAHSN